MAFTIFLAPLIGALICGFGWRMIGEVAAAWTGTALLALASVLSWVAFLSLGDGTPVQVMRWIESGSLTADWALRVDLLAAVMLVVATSMGLLVSMFALGDPTQAEQEGQRARLVGFIALFVFSVVALVTADNLVQLLFGWEVMTVAAYLLIGYRNGRAGSNAAAVKAFVVNKAGDIGLWLGVAVTFLLVDSVAFDDIFATLPELVGVEVPFLGEVPNAVGLMAALFLIGALAKSAQLPLHAWLPDASTGPTPGTAMINGVMLTAGAFLILRIAPVFEGAAGVSSFAVWLGAVTAVFLAAVAIAQTDVKRVVACAAGAHAGAIFVALGLGYFGAALALIVAHAMVFGLLSLVNGAVMHATGGKRNLHRLGGLRSKMPGTFWLALVGTLAAVSVGLPGVVGMIGYSQGVSVVEGAYLSSPFVLLLLVAAAALGSFALWRLVFAVFLGKGHGEGELNVSTWLMQTPLVLLAVAAVLGGFALSPLSEEVSAPGWVGFAPLMAAALGLVAALVLHGRGPVAVDDRNAIHRAAFAGFYVDAVYNFVVVQAAEGLGRWFYRIIDGRLLDGAARAVSHGVVPFLNGLIARLQSGYVATYFIGSIFGLAVLVGFATLQGGGLLGLAALLTVFMMRGGGQ